MLTIESQMTLQGLNGREVTDFLVDCTDAAYREWWPGTHHEFHVLEHGPGEGHVGDLLWMDEYVGSRHLRMAAEVLEAVPGERLVWGLRPWGLKPPVRLTLTLDAHDAGVVLRHTLTAGWAGWARVLDPLWRLYFTEAFAEEMDRHAKTEFPLLAHLLHPECHPSSSRSATEPRRVTAPDDGTSTWLSNRRPSRSRVLGDRLRDARGRRVMLVSHCLLNQNTRYAGGATQPGALVDVVDELLRERYGVHQLPCPERLAWGGVSKRHSLLMYDSKGGPLYPFRGVLLRGFLWWTRLVYWRLARQVARDVADYQRSGIAVAGIIGIGASPSCGVTTTLDLRASLDFVAACPMAALTREVMNDRAVLGCRRPGKGMFIEALDRQLARRRLTLPAFEHDLVTELQGRRQAVLDAPAARTLGSQAGPRPG